MGEAQMPLPDIRAQTAVSLEYMPTFPASAPHTAEVFYTLLHFWKCHSFTPQSSQLSTKPAQNDFLFECPKQFIYFLTNHILSQCLHDLFYTSDSIVNY